MYTDFRLTSCPKTHAYICNDELDSLTVKCNPIYRKLHFNILRFILLRVYCTCQLFRHTYCAKVTVHLDQKIYVCFRF